MEERRSNGFRVKPSFGQVLGYIQEGEPLTLDLPNRKASIYTSSHWFLDDYPNAPEPLSDAPLPHTTRNRRRGLRRSALPTAAQRVHEAVVDFADFAAMSGLDLVGPTPSSAPTASSVESAPALGVGSVAGQPAMGVAPALDSPAPGDTLEDFAVPPTSGEPVSVESTAGDEDIAPPVMGVPPSSGDEDELLADHAGAPLLGVDLVDGEAQTEHFSPISAFDALFNAHDVAVQTTNEVMFSTFSQEALATAIRALSRDDRVRLVGAMRLAEEQPLVDVAPTGGADAPSSPSGPHLDLLDLTPGLPSGSTGVVDPGPSPATARTFWEEQDATAVAEMAAAKPVPDDDIDAGPPTSLEVFLAEQDAAAKNRGVLVVYVGAWA